MISKETKAFVEAAFKELQRYDKEKGAYGWRYVPRIDLVRKLRKHVAQLDSLLKAIAFKPDGYENLYKACSRECLHILNYLFMLYDRAQPNPKKGRVYSMTVDFKDALDVWLAHYKRPKNMQDAMQLLSDTVWQANVHNVPKAAVCAQFIWLEMTNALNNYPNLTATEVLAKQNEAWVEAEKTRRRAAYDALLEAHKQFSEHLAAVARNIAKAQPYKRVIMSDGTIIMAPMPKEAPSAQWRKPIVKRFYKDNPLIDELLNATTMDARIPGAFLPTKPNAQHWIMAPVIPHPLVPRPWPLVPPSLKDHVEYAGKCAVKSAIEFKDNSSLDGVTVFKPDVFISKLVENLTGVKAVCETGAK